MEIKEKKNQISTWVFNPFYFWGGSKLFWIGLAVIAIHIPVGYFFNVRFDGAIDMHLAFDVSFIRVILDVVFAWTSLFMCFYLSALAFKSPIRLVDICGATAVARIPLLLSVLPAKIFAPEAQSVEEILSLEGTELTVLIVGSLVVLLFLAWFIILLFNAFKVNSNLKGWKLHTGFWTALIVAELIALYLIRNLTVGIG